VVNNLLDKIYVFRLPILVIGGVVAAAWAVGSYWYDRKESLWATYAIEQVSLPPQWNKGLRTPVVQILIIRITKSSSKRIQLEGVSLVGVQEIHGVTVRLPERVEPQEPKWRANDHDTGRFQTVSISNLPPLPGGYASLEIYAWGNFASHPYLDVIVDTNEGNVSASYREAYPHWVVFITRNLPWIALIIFCGAIGGALVYLDKKARPPNL
jgi:hypothetical protein